MKYILLTFIFLFISCKKDETPQTIPKTGVELVAIGSINFGGLVVGETREAAIRIYNYGPDNLNVVGIQSLLTNPYSIISVSAPCTSGVLPAKQNCIIAVKFSPTNQGLFEQNFNIGNASMKISGRGMVDGVMSLSDNSWVIGDTIAGIEHKKVISITNNGDFTIQSPIMNMPTGISIGLNTCGGYITPLKTCIIELISKKLISGIYNENIIFSIANQSLQINYQANIDPNEPAGIIDFPNAPTSIVADGLSEVILESGLIKDKYGNIVKDGTIVGLSTFNLNLLSSNNVQTMNGKISFHLKATAVRGQSVLTLTSGEAVGVLRLRAISGVPYGTISLQSFDNNVVANGQSVVSIISNGIFDANGNVVEDGTIVYYELIGNGMLSNSFGQVILGRISLSIIAPTIVGTSILKLKSGPIYDSSNNITGWSAEGSYIINWIPGIPVSPIPITTTEAGIYAEEDFTAEEQGIAIRTQGMIGPIRDSKGNIVANNTPITVTAENGKLLYVSTNPYVYYTDANGFIYFNVSGNGSRGKIVIKAEHEKGAIGTHDIWAFKQENLIYSAGPDNKVFLQEMYHSNSLPTLDNWNNTTDYSGIQFADSNSQYGQNVISFEQYHSTVAKDWLINLPFILNDCYFTAKTYVVLGPCQKDKEVLNHGPFAYNTLSLFNPSEINNFGIDKPLNAVHNTRAELDYCDFFNQGTISNGDLSPKINGCNDELDAGRFCRWDNTVFNQNFQMFGYCVPRPIQNGGYSYNERYDQLLVHGGHLQRLKYQDINQTTFVNLMDDTYNYSSIFNNVIKFGVNSVTTKQNGDEEFEEIGSYPYHKIGMMSFAQKENLSFGIGGYEQTLNCNIFATEALCENGTSGICSWDTNINACRNLGASSLSMDSLEIVIFNHANKKWSSVLPNPDSNEFYDTGAPTERYQHKLIYSEKDNSLYLIGGLRKFQCSEFKNSSYCSLSGEIANRCIWNPSDNVCEARPGKSDKGWIQGNDIGKTDNWKLSLNNLNIDGSGDLEWKRLCGSQKQTRDNNQPNPANISCGIGEVYQNLDIDPSAFPKKTNAVWNGNRQKMYVNISEQAEMYALNLNSGLLELVNDGAETLAGAYQLLYNKISGRMFGYFRNNINTINSLIKVWDMNPNEKKYYRAKFLIGAGSKNVAYEITPIITAYGYTTNSLTINNNGVETYIYNHDLSQWDFLDDNDASTQSQSQSQSLIKTFNRNTNISQYISNNGYVDILIFAKGTPQNNSQSMLIIDQVKLEGKF